MTDEKLHALLHFLFSRFAGFIPDDKMLVNGIADFRREHP